MTNSRPACLVQIYPWENPRWCAADVSVKEGDTVVVMLDYCAELSVVKEVSNGYKGEIQGKISRIASTRDMQAYADNENKREELLRTGKEEMKQMELSMKLVD